MRSAIVIVVIVLGAVSPEAAGQSPWPVRVKGGWELSVGSGKEPSTTIVYAGPPPAQQYNGGYVQQPPAAASVPASVQAVRLSPLEISQDLKKLMYELDFSDENQFRTWQAAVNLNKEVNDNGWGAKPEVLAGYLQEAENLRAYAASLRAARPQQQAVQGYDSYAGTAQSYQGDSTTGFRPNSSLNMSASTQSYQPAYYGSAPQTSYAGNPPAYVSPAPAPVQQYPAGYTQATYGGVSSGYVQAPRTQQAPAGYSGTTVYAGAPSGYVTAPPAAYQPPGGYYYASGPQTAYVTSTPGYASAPVQAYQGCPGGTCSTQSSRLYIPVVCDIWNFFTGCDQSPSSSAGYYQSTGPSPSPWPAR